FSAWASSSRWAWGSRSCRAGRSCLRGWKFEPGGAPNHRSLSRRENESAVLLAAAPGGEEVAEHLAALVSQNAAHDFQAVVEPRVGAELVQRVDAAHLRVRGAVHDAGDPGVDQSASAHRARLERDGDGAVDQTPVAQRTGRG